MSIASACGIPDHTGGGSNELDDAALDGVFVSLRDLEVGRGGLGLEPVALDCVLKVDRS